MVFPHYEIVYERSNDYFGHKPHHTLHTQMDVRLYAFSYAFSGPLVHKMQDYTLGMGKAYNHHVSLCVASDMPSEQMPFHILNMDMVSHQNVY
jgi:hypothetical protein